MISQSGRLLALFTVIAVVVQSQPLSADAHRPFTVRDSIEMTTFSDPYTRLPDAECKVSPDGRHFLVITTKGVLRTNQLVSTLWVMSAAAIDEFLHGKRGTPPPPQLLLRVAGMPVSRQSNSYGSLITKAQWSSDSQSILSLVEQANGYHHLFRTSLSGKASIDLDPGDVDITDFNEAGGTIAYLVVEHMLPSKVMGEPIDSGSSDLTGLSLFHILFPKTLPDPASYWPAIDLWVHYRGKNRQINDGKWHFPSSAAWLRIGVSPDGRSLIAARPVPSVPAEWSQYQTVGSAASFLPSHTGTDRSGKAYYWPWQYVHIDLEKMTVTPLVDAPSAMLAGYIDPAEAVWSRDSRSVLFTNSFLPLAKSAAPARPAKATACAVAIYEPATRAVGCIAYPRFPKQNEWLQEVGFGATSDEVVLHWSGTGTNEIDVYRRTARTWELEPRAEAVEEAQPGLKILIRQDINQPPALWASEPMENLAKELWDPNPQLASFELGKASVYTWKDNTGYGWHAGLVLPPNFMPGRRYPLVIQQHGFYNDHEFLVDGSFTTGFAARPLAAAGIIVLQMEDRADRHVRPAQQEALLAVDGFESAIDSLDRDGLIDRARVGVIGFSRTAWYAEEALIHDPHLFRAATLIDGVDQSYVNYVLFAAPEDPEGSREAEAANGGKPIGAGLEDWLKNAAGFNLDKVQVPVRIEALGPISILSEWEIYSCLHQQGKPVDLVYIPNGQHILQKPQERYASQQGNVDWFRFWLEGYQDPDPAKRNQYRRWGQMEGHDVAVSLR